MSKILYILAFVLFHSSVYSYINVSQTKGTFTATVKMVKIKVETDENPIFGVFHWDKVMDLWVKVIGETGQLLGDFDMKEANMVDLRGGGTFYLEVYTKKGIGNFECTFINSDKGLLKKVNETYDIQVYTGCDPLYVIYDWDEELELWAKIIDEKDQIIADMDLSKGNVSKLNGGGKFIIRLYSRKGSGNWEIFLLNSKEWEMRNKN